MEANGGVLPTEYHEFERGGEYLFFDPRNFVWFRTDALGRAVIHGFARGGEAEAARAVAERAGVPVRCATIYVGKWLRSLQRIGFLHRGSYSARLPEKVLAEHPIDLYVHMTARCNLRCVYCYNLDHRDQMRPVPAGTQAQFLGLVDEAAEMGFESVRLTGGEALLNPSTLVVARRAKGIGLRVNLLTNGTLITPALAEEIVEVVDSVSLSLDSADASEHDLMRGRGSHAKVLRAIELLREAGLQFLHLNAVITPTNRQSVRRFLEYAWDELGADDVTLAPSDFELPDPNGRRHAKSYVLDRKAIGEVTAIEIGFYEERGRPFPLRRSQLWRCHCGAGNGVVSVDADGEVYPCQTMHAAEFACGNAFRDGLRNVLASSPTVERMRGLTVDSIDGCRRCPMRTICGGGCRFMAYCREGRIDARDRFACRHRFQLALEKLWSAPTRPLSASPSEG